MTGKGQALMPKYKVETQKLKKNFNQEEQSITQEKTRGTKSQEHTPWQNRETMENTGRHRREQAQVKHTGMGCDM